MKLDWNNWTVGGKVIFITACVAVLSMFMDWVDVGILTSSGFSQGAVLFLLFLVYPVLRLLQNKEIHKIAGFACGILSVVSTVLYISSKSIDWMGKTVNASGVGAYLFLLASVALIFGIFKYRADFAPHTNEEVKS